MLSAGVSGAFGVSIKSNDSSEYRASCFSDMVGEVNGKKDSSQQLVEYLKHRVPTLGLLSALGRVKMCTDQGVRSKRPTNKYG